MYEQQQPYPVWPAPAPPPRKRMRTRTALLIVAGVLSLAVLCCAGAGFVVWRSGAVDAFQDGYRKAEQHASLREGVCLVDRPKNETGGTDGVYADIPEVVDCDSPRAAYRIARAVSGVGLGAMSNLVTYEDYYCKDVPRMEVAFLVPDDDTTGTVYCLASKPIGS
ncbi:hypothetical protein Cs7R123_00820 [Catellatospora sp. TT07R-123]|uniref:hypothetical protein n=1 Tax=Catellatospora sp. TT07R-123 TaxID=2733863 RepID=UPI001B1BD829|nr:hypothetical protein [Catellatospora sp. TT07R-123]GHJ42740.1 hypothetical protein Cs7R123_00820 [Catellatospora sp. TT07R-123]